MTNNEFVNILLKIVKNFPFAPCKQPKGFALVHSEDSYTTTAFEKTYEDYERGEFWARDWSALGANRDSMKIEYPAVVIRQLDISPNQKNKAKDCHKFEIGVIDVPDCETCPSECKRSLSQVKNDILFVLKNIHLELLRQGVYDTNLGELWGTVNEMTALQGNGIITVFADAVGSDLQSMIKNESNYQYSKFGLDKEIGVFMSLDVCSCFTDLVNFKYDLSGINISEVTKCSTCI